MKEPLVIPSHDLPYSSHQAAHPDYVHQVRVLVIVTGLVYQRLQRLFRKLEYRLGPL